ncbi:MAG: hypothetical protein WKF89_06675 [Chitinophagaceae bacterium]
MSKPEWIETRKECDVNEEGKLVVKKVTLERRKRIYLGLERKDIIDISIRLISLGAIFIPLLLFYKQQKAERDKQKTFFQLELYSTTTTELHSLTNKPLGSKEFDLSKNKLLYEIYPKLRLLSENVVTDTFLVLKDIIGFSSILSKAFNHCDTLKKHLGNYAELAGNKDAGKYGIETEQLLSQSMQNVTNSQREILQWTTETEPGRNFTKDHKRKVEEALFTLRNDVDSVFESMRLNSLANYPYDRLDRPSSSIDSLHIAVSNSTIPDQLNFSFDRLHSLKSNYISQLNNQTQYYTSKLDSIMVESTKLLYSK